MITATAESVERNKRNVRRFLDHTHSGRFDVIDEAVCPHIVTHGFPGKANPASRAEYRRFFMVLDEAFPRMAFHLHTLVAGDDHVAARFTVRGRHEGDFFGIAATGREVAFDGMAIYRMEEGRIAETWLCPDNLALLGQLGVLHANTG